MILIYFRWLLSRNKFRQATDILIEIARINGKHLSSHEIENLQELFRVKEISLEVTSLENEFEKSQIESSSSFLSVLKNPLLFVRTLHCSLTWVSE